MEQVDELHYHGLYFFHFSADTPNRWRVLARSVSTLKGERRLPQFCKSIHTKEHFECDLPTTVWHERAYRRTYRVVHALNFGCGLHPVDFGGSALVVESIASYRPGGEVCAPCGSPDFFTRVRVVHKTSVCPVCISLFAPLV